MLFSSLFNLGTGCIIAVMCPLDRTYPLSSSRPCSAGLDLVGLHCFLVDLQARCLCFLRILFTLLRLACLVLLPVVSRMLCNLSSRVWILISHQQTRSVYDIVHLAYLLAMGCTLWILLSKTFCSLLFRSYDIPSFYGRYIGSYCPCTLRLLGCESHSCRNCGISSFGLHICFLYHPLAIMSVCCCTHLLHLQICLLYPLDLILFSA
jgi:hypothetical protein